MSTYTISRRMILFALLLKAAHAHDIMLATTPIASISSRRFTSRRTPPSPMHLIRRPRCASPPRTEFHYQLALISAIVGIFERSAATARLLLYTLLMSTANANAHLMAPPDECRSITSKRDRHFSLLAAHTSRRCRKTIGKSCPVNSAYIH